MIIVMVRLKKIHVEIAVIGNVSSPAPVDVNHSIGIVAVKNESMCMITSQRLAPIVHRSPIAEFFKNDMHP